MARVRGWQLAEWRGRARSKLGLAVLRALLRYARAQPSPQPATARERVVILLVSAWGMGGTIRAALNLAAYLSRDRDVEILSTVRFRDESFFGAFPPGVTVEAIDDQRPGGAPRGPVRWIRRALDRVPSVLVHPADRAAQHHTLWFDLQVARRLRRGSGYLIATRPGLNMAVARLRLPGFVTIGEEQMHLLHHDRRLRAAMPQRYRGLDALVVLTERDVERYTKLLKGKVRVERIPNTVRELSGRPADPGAKVVLAAGRMTAQKGFDMLIDAYAQVAREHPDWRLRICGAGPWRKRLEAQIDAHALADVIELPGPSDDLGGEMEAASIFVLSSRFEGFPLVLLEAMSKRLAVVAFDCPTGPSDIVDDHENGILVPPKDVDGLARGIREMIEHEELRRRCGAAAVDTARQYAIDAIGPRWDALFRELAQGRAHAAGVAAPVT